MLKTWRRLMSAFASGLLLFTVLINVHAGPAVAAAAAVAQGTEQDVFRIVALGDSITAGYEPGMTDPSVKPYGYAERLLEQGWYHGRSELKNYGILGLKTAGLLQYTGAIKDSAVITPEAIQPGLSDPRTLQFAALAPQIRTELAAADLITITIGGNDVSSLFLNYKTLTDADFASQLAERLTEYSSNVTALLKNIREVNPQATILLADQYQPAPKIALGASYDKLMNAAAQFTIAAENIAATLNQAGAPLKVAHVAAKFAGVEGSLTHIIGAGAADFHPTQLGYERIATVFAEMQWGEYRTLTVTAMASRQRRCPSW